VVNLRYAFQDDENCFFVLDLMLGGDLRCSSISIIYHPSHRLTFGTVHLDRLGSLPEESVRFHMAELSSAVCFLHEKHIMHRFALPSVICPFHLLWCHSRRSNRDIKPDNILLDERGHAHLTDFNIAVHYSDRRLLTGVAGSMAYMAPEILHKRGYTSPIDWWSLGVCAFELLFGRRPFRGRTNTALTHSISKDPLRFPENAEEKCSVVGLNFISGVRLPLLPARCLTGILSFAAPGEGSAQTHCV
jgi:serine/threonine kinase 32